MASDEEFEDEDEVKCKCNNGLSTWDEETLCWICLGLGDDPNHKMFEFKKELIDKYLIGLAEIAILIYRLRDYGEDTSMYQSPGAMTRELADSITRTLHKHSCTKIALTPEEIRKHISSIQQRIKPYGPMLLRMPVDTPEESLEVVRSEWIKMHTN